MSKFWLSASIVLAMGYAAYAKEDCAVEIKMLIAPSDQARALAQLGFSKHQRGRVFFYDTAGLDLLKQGVILRIRQGDEDNDLTVKLRPPEDRSFADPSRGREDFNCESDLNNGVPQPSYSIKVPFSEGVPKKGTELAKYLSVGQRALIREAGARIDWGDVRQQAEITSSAWERKKTPDLPKVSLELWEWSQNRSVLELSTKVEAGSAQTVEQSLKQLALQNDLLVGCDSKPKTRLVLESVTGSK